jgi:hypothetical protein
LKCAKDIEELIQATATLLRIGDNRRANAFASAAIDGCQSAACATTLSARLSRLGNNYGAVRSAKKAQTLGVSRQDQLYPLIDLPPRARDQHEDSKNQDAADSDENDCQLLSHVSSSAGPHRPATHCVVKKG